jgi:hypothetical protein
MPLHDQETFRVEPACFTLGATGFASAEMADAVSRLSVPKSRKATQAS